MFERFKNKIIRKELNKIQASSVAQLYDILCNTYNNGYAFKNVKE